MGINHELRIRGGGQSGLGGVMFGVFVKSLEICNF